MEAKRYSCRIVYERLRDPATVSVPVLQRWKRVRAFGPWPVTAVSGATAREFIMNKKGPAISAQIKPGATHRLRPVAKKISEAAYMEMSGVAPLFDLDGLVPDEGDTTYKES